jgi:preprotein translocase subunit YajC
MALNVQVDPTVIWKTSFPNLLWVKALTPTGLTMDCVIYDANTDTWAKFEAFQPRPTKAQEYVNPLQIKKGDTVTLNDGGRGKIVRYPSNKEIAVEASDGTVKVVTKNDIKAIFAHA